MTGIIVKPEKAHVFICIQSNVDWYSEDQLYSGGQIWRPLMRMLKNSNWILSDEAYKGGFWRVLRLSNKNTNILFVPVVCPFCFPKYSDAGLITKEWERDHYLRCDRCDKIWKEEAFELVVGTKPHIPLTEFKS
jgi:hypothetical protein